MPHTTPGGQFKRQRRMEALDRKIARDERTNAQQIKLIENRPGDSKKERAQLTPKDK